MPLPGQGGLIQKATPYCRMRHGGLVTRDQNGMLPAERENTSVAVTVNVAEAVQKVETKQPLKPQQAGSMADPRDDIGNPPTTHTHVVNPAKVGGYFLY
jgi:hypothetical protein